jgi:replicative DNA helicase
MTLEKLMPQNIEAEQGVLGSIIIDPEAIVQVAEFLTPDDFYRESHRLIYRVILDLYEGRSPADFITICDELERCNKLEDVGGASYITSLINHVATSSNVEYYGRIIEREAILRRLIEAAGQIAAVAYQEEDADIALDKAEQLIFNVSQRHISSSPTSHRDGLAQYIEALVKRAERNAEGKLTRGIPSGISSLDMMTGGWQRGDLIILAAATSVGKSSFALQVAADALQHGYSTLVYSMEMNKETIWQRWLALATGIDQRRLRDGWILNEPIAQQKGSEIIRYDSEWDIIFKKYGHLMDLPGTLWVDDSREITPTHIKSVARRMKTEHALDLIVVDYTQLVTPMTRHKERRDLEIAEVTRSLRAMAGDLDVPVLALAQLNREGAKGEPQLYHLRESGAQEQDADVVLFLWTENQPDEPAYHTTKEDEEEKLPEPYPVKLKIAKQRNGPRGQLDLNFTPWLTRFDEV